MDTSPEYVKMCDKALEIQKLYPRAGCDCGNCGSGKAEWGYSPRLKKMVWLPRQDELQEMVTAQNLCGYRIENIKKAPIIDNLLCTFEQFYRKQHWWGKAERLDKRPTMEQLWLAFVMKEKFNKTWTGKEWREEP